MRHLNRTEESALRVFLVQCGRVQKQQVTSHMQLNGLFGYPLGKMEPIILHEEFQGIPHTKGVV